MLKQFFIVLICLVMLVLFLVVFGGFAFIDFAIKLMWLVFGFLVTFICNNLDITFIVDRVNRFLAKYNLKVSENPRVKSDSITFYNMEWQDKQGNVMHLPQIEVRIDAYRLLLDYFKKDKLQSILEDVKEISISKPHLRMTIDPDQGYRLPVGAEEDVVADIVRKRLSPKDLEPIKIRINIDNGTLIIKTGDQQLELDNIEGTLLNQPEVRKGEEIIEERKFDLHLSCLYEGENISLRNYLTEEKFVLNGSKVMLVKMWQAAKLWLPIIPPDMELFEGKMTDIRVMLDASGWQQCKLEEFDMHLEECSVSCSGLRVENLEGCFHTRDVNSILCRRLEFDLNEQHLRLKGTIAVGENKGQYNYNIKSSANRFFWKDNLDLYVLPGFGINGLLELGRKEIKLLVNMDEGSSMRLHTPHDRTAVISRLQGTFSFMEGCLCFPLISCALDDRKVHVEDGHLDLKSGDYTLKGHAEELELTLLSDAPVTGKFSGQGVIAGNIKDKKTVIEGDYEIRRLKYEKWSKLNLGEGNLKGRLIWQEDGVQLVDNRIFIKNSSFEVPSCKWEKGKIHIEFPSLGSYLKDKLQSAKDVVRESWNKVACTDTEMSERKEAEDKNEAVEVEVLPIQSEEPKKAEDNFIKKILFQSQILWDFEFLT